VKWWGGKWWGSQGVAKGHGGEGVLGCLGHSESLVPLGEQLESVPCFGFWAEPGCRGSSIDFSAVPTAEGRELQVETQPAWGESHVSAGLMEGKELHCQPARPVTVPDLPSPQLPLLPGSSWSLLRAQEGVWVLQRTGALGHEAPNDLRASLQCGM
jgi:hypothetical protein